MSVGKELKILTPVLETQNPQVQVAKFRSILKADCMKKIQGGNSEWNQQDWREILNIWGKKERARDWIMLDRGWGGFWCLCYKPRVGLAMQSQTRSFTGLLFSYLPCSWEGDELKWFLSPVLPLHALAPWILDFLISRAAVTAFCGLAAAAAAESLQEQPSVRKLLQCLRRNERCHQPPASPCPLVLASPTCSRWGFTYFSHFHLSVLLLELPAVWQLSQSCFSLPREQPQFVVSHSGVQRPGPAMVTLMDLFFCWSCCFLFPFFCPQWREQVKNWLPQGKVESAHGISWWFAQLKAHTVPGPGTKMTCSLFWHPPWALWGNCTTSSAPRGITNLLKHLNIQ